MSAANNPAQITAAANADPSQMGFITTTLSQTDLADLAAYIGTFAAPVPAAPVDVVEFYNAGRDHYFMSGSRRPKLRTSTRAFTRVGCGPA